MTSLFEQVGPASRLPAGMVSDLMARGNCSVAALNFLAVDEDSAACAERRPAVVVSETALPAVDERALQVAAMIDAAREDAAEQEKQEMQAEWDVQQQRERARAERLTVEFARDRRRYFAAAEAQVVKLAMAVAERILSREIANCTLPLSATVQAALARVQDASETILRVRPEQAEQWRGFFADEPRVSVMEDLRIAVDDCVLDTRIGRIELGVVTQMQEIERGFDDLMTRTGD